ncbi:MAG: hypothetical protein H6603_08025 [Flavobacteriales bacterium]|nr:hypothetical protein [Flavobacteriales bacterium]
MENRVTFFRFSNTNSAYSGVGPASHQLNYSKLTTAQKRLEELKNTLNNWKIDPFDMPHKGGRISGKELIGEFEGFLRKQLLQKAKSKKLTKDSEQLFEEIVEFVYDSGGYNEGGFNEYSEKKTRWIKNEDRLELGKGMLSQLDWKRYPSHKQIFDLIKKVEEEFTNTIRNLHETVQSMKELEEEKKRKSAEISRLESEIPKLKKSLVDEYEKTNRIDVEDISNLNAEISKMNTEGWTIKQIEGINSGIKSVSTSFSHPTEGGGGAGWGYGFGYTEGVMVVWERKETK